MAKTRNQAKKRRHQDFPAEQSESSLFRVFALSRFRGSLLGDAATIGGARFLLGSRYAFERNYYAALLV